MGKIFEKSQLKCSPQFHVVKRAKHIDLTFQAATTTVYRVKKSKVLCAAFWFWSPLKKTLKLMVIFPCWQLTWRSNTWGHLAPCWSLPQPFQLLLKSPGVLCAQEIPAGILISESGMLEIITQMSRFTLTRSWLCWKTPINDNIDVNYLCPFF